MDRGRSTVVRAAAPCCCVLRVSMALRPAQWRCLDYLELMKGEQSNEDGADILTLRFVGGDGEGHGLHELRAAHVAEVLEGLVGLAGDFARAGVFGVGPPPEVLVRPPSEGSFVIEVVNWFAENKEPLAVVGVPSLGSAIWWATKSLRAEVSNFEHLENGKVKVQWQDNTVEEIPRAAWDELNKRKPGWDCSGLTMRAWGAAGVRMPRTTFQQVLIGTSVPSTAAMHPGALPDLPVMMSDGGGRGISTWAFVQSFAQLRARWGRDGADSIWGASSIKLLLGGCTEADDLERISRVVGERRVRRQSHTSPTGSLRGPRCRPPPLWSAKGSFRSKPSPGYPSARHSCCIARCQLLSSDSLRGGNERMPMSSRRARPRPCA